jgi:hypothetical protein
MLRILILLILLVICDNVYAGRVLAGSHVSKRVMTTIGIHRVLRSVHGKK